MPGAGLSVSLTLTYDKRPSDFGLAHKRSHTMTTCTAETQCMTPFNLFFDRKRSSACPHVELPSPIISYSPVRSQMSSWNRGHPEKHNSTNMRDKRERWEASRTRQDLSRDDLLFLLSILEGELQARDEVIAVLKSERTDSALLGAQYGFSGPEKPLRALQRDSLRAQQYQLQDVYKNPTAQLNHMVKAQKRSSERMLEQLLEVSRSHSGALRRLEEQERNHRAFIHKSNCLTALLEQDRERLKLLTVKEREYQEIKEKKSQTEVSALKDELTQLKAFALLVVTEQQRLSELLEEQRRRVRELTAITDHIEREAGAAKTTTLEVEHCKQVSVFNRGMMTAPPSLLSEVEMLRRRVVEMEGKDEELLRMWDQCRDLDRRLARETSHCRSLRVEVDKLNGRISELDRIEEALGKSKQDCGILKGSLEREREVSRMLSAELDTLKVRVRELEAIEGQLEKSEAVIRQDLAKLRSLTVALVEDRKTMAERLRQAEEKLNRKEGRRSEQSNLAPMTERRGDEKQQTLRSKADLEERIKVIAKEKDELQDRLQTEEERNRELQSKITTMKRRLQVLENRKEKGEKYGHSSINPNNPNHQCQTEDNKVKELAQELDRLRKRLQDKEMVEGELMKVEEEFESLQKRFRDEQRRSQALTEELEMAKRELSRYDQAEKQEVNQEHLLLCRLQKEQVKSRLLGREVETLKEKLQKLMGTEESICRVQTDHSTLQRKLIQQEARNRELAREMKELNSELDRYRRIKNLTPGASRHFSDLHQTSKEVQTEEKGSLPPDYSMHAEKLDKEYEDEDPNHNAEVMNRSSSLVNNLNSLNSANNNISQYSSHSPNSIDMHQTVNGEVMMLTHTPGQPLHIKVTPHHILNTATLEISSPTGDSASSYTSTAVIPTSGASPKQRITIIQNSTPSAVNTKTPPSSPDRTISPLNGTAVPRVLSTNSSRSVTPDHNSSPIQIVTVRTCSPEPSEVTGQAVFCKTPERQNSWKSNSSGDTSPSIITTEDNKIHIHLGSPYIQPLNGMTHGTPQPVGPYYLRHEQRTQVLANGCHVKGVGKITSSITISPATSSASHSSNITVSGLCD
ncbi:filamin A-interacting protein 1-like isoform X1 [Larimichthys crocea]|uniref:filamin A-interacting protein 1-like isoform X1 n=2 Tax=Larimichthys crocea TaxID=215358 RepID=UPI000F5D835E|nr:filamin A-interacting protein 1-like isoform X1 [Larimichthys crocea]XP_027146875.1 filamin A-interacting protein 1-like isoform X1 [Larimichthys crocea]